MPGRPPWADCDTDTDHGPSDASDDDDCDYGSDNADWSRRYNELLNRVTEAQHRLVDLQANWPGVRPWTNDTPGKAARHLRHMLKTLKKLEENDAWILVGPRQWYNRATCEHYHDLDHEW